jgi:hypothetical protein
MKPQEPSKTPSPEPILLAPITPQPATTTTPNTQESKVAATPEHKAPSPIETPQSETNLPVTPVDGSPSQASIDSVSRVKQMAKQFDEDPVLHRKRSSNFIANAKAKYAPVTGRKRTVSNESDYGVERSSVGTLQERHPSIFDIAGAGRESRLPLPIRGRGRSGSGEVPVMADAADKDDGSRSPTPEVYLRKVSLPADEEAHSKMPAAPEAKVLFKPVEYEPKRDKTPPMKVIIPDISREEMRKPEVEEIPAVTRTRSDSIFVESPVLGDIVPEISRVSQVSLPTPTTPVTPPTATIPPANPLAAIPEETQPLNIAKPESHLHRAAAMVGLAAHLDKFANSKLPVSKKVESPIPSPAKIEHAPPMISSTPGSSASSNLAEPLSSYEDLGKYSGDDQHDPYNDARSDTSVEPMGESKSTSLQSLEIKSTTEMSDATVEQPQVSPSIAKSPSRASRIWAEKQRKNIHTSIVNYVDDGHEVTPSPIFKTPSEEPVAQNSTDSDIPLDSPTPYKNSLRDYDLFRSLTKKMALGSKERLDVLMSTKPLTQKNICRAFFGYNNIVELLENELTYLTEHNIGLSELILNLWLGKEVDDEALLRAILFGKTNGMADSLILSIAPLGILLVDLADGSFG